MSFDLKAPQSSLIIDDFPLPLPPIIVFKCGLNSTSISLSLFRTEFIIVMLFIQKLGIFSGISLHTFEVLILKSYDNNACTNPSNVAISPILTQVYSFPIPHKPCPESFSEAGLSENANIGNLDLLILV